MSLEGKSTEVINGLAAFSDKLLSGPLRLKTLRLAKEADPNFKHTELDIAEQIEAAGDDKDKRIDGLEKQLMAQRLEDARREKTRELKEQGFDIVAVEKVMTDRGISNYESAVNYIRGERALAPPTPHSERTSTQMPTEMKDIAKNPTKWARDKAEQVMNEIIAARPAA